MKLRLIVNAEGTATHCSNDCQFMSLDAQSCGLFNVRLSWDTTRRTNGNLRLPGCKRAESAAKPPKKRASGRRK